MVVGCLESTAVVLRFVGIGAPKCATTWMYDVLRSHPEVSFPAKKEVNFWVGSAERDLAWYRATMGADDPSACCGEISVSYVRLPVRRIRELHAHAPDVRLFLNVRHPVDRAWSRARMRARVNGIDLFALSDGGLIHLIFGDHNIESGDYAAALDRWLSVFPAEQLLVTQFDDVVARPQWVIDRLCHHLGLDPELLASRRVTTSKAMPPPPERALPAAIRAVLTQVYAEPMRRLRDQYGIDYTGPGRA
jgi:hypothetical protein